MPLDNSQRTDRISRAIYAIKRHATYIRHLRRPFRRRERPGLESHRQVHRGGQRFHLPRCDADPHKDNQDHHALTNSPANRERGGGGGTCERGYLAGRRHQQRWQGQPWVRGQRGPGKAAGASRMVYDMRTIDQRPRGGCSTKGWALGHSNKRHAGVS